MIPHVGFQPSRPYRTTPSQVQLPASLAHSTPQWLQDGHYAWHRLTFHWFSRETEPCHIAKCFHNGFPEPIAFSNHLNLSKSLRPCPFLVSCRFLHRFSKHMAVWISFLECLQHWIADDRCPCPVKPGLSILKRLPRSPGSICFFRRRSQLLMMLVQPSLVTSRTISRMISVMPRNDCGIKTTGSIHPARWSVFLAAPFSKKTQL